MEKKEEQFNNQNYNQEDELVSEEDRDKKKKARILLIIEGILFLLVIILAFIFFSSKGSIKFNIFQKSDDRQIINNAPGDGNLVIDDNIIDSQGNNNSTPNNPDVATPESNNSQRVESVRLSLPVPSQSIVSTEDQIPEGAIKILGMEDGFYPAEFTVSAGE